MTAVTSYWTEADGAEPDVLLWALVSDYWEDRELCVAMSIRVDPLAASSNLAA